jgi:hypothetical protein
MPNPIKPTKVLFIKLGSEGGWEEECIEKNQTLRIGFDKFLFQDCMKAKQTGDWSLFTNYYRSVNKAPQWVTTFVNQLKYFYMESPSTLWITFYKQKLWWCFASDNFDGINETLKTRKVLGSWSCRDINGKELLIENLSGDLLQTQGYQSTICEVRAADYAIKKINGEVLAEVKRVEEDLLKLKNSISHLVRKLTPKDFELLVDLIFRNAGCQRVGVIGGPQKTKDIELLAPVTNERYLVQVKSKSSMASFSEYKSYFEQLEGYDRFYYVVHSPEGALNHYTSDDSKIILWKMEEITDFCINSGLISWLVNKVS